LAGFGVRLLGGGLGGLVHAAGVLGLAGLEAVLESAGDVLQVPRAASADGLSPLGLLTPVELAGLGGRVAAGRALMLLDVQRATTASTAQSVRLVVTLTKAGGTLRYRTKTRSVKAQLIGTRSFVPLSLLSCSSISAGVDIPDRCACLPSAIVGRH
jgi:hypothetical protein